MLRRRIRSDDNRFSPEIFGSRNQRLVKQYQKTVAAINALETQIEKLTDDQLRGKTDEFRQRVAAGESLDKLLPEAFAVCREASRRVLKMRHFDVQLIGGMVLHYGKIAEMRTGEGKTLVATLPVYLNALVGQRRACGDGERLSRPAAMRNGWVRFYNFLGHDHGLSSCMALMEHDQNVMQAYACRHHLRHKQRIRLRLSAR